MHLPAAAFCYVEEAVENLPNLSFILWCRQQEEEVVEVYHLLHRQLQACQGCIHTFEFHGCTSRWYMQSRKERDDDGARRYSYRHVTTFSRVGRCLLRQGIASWQGFPVSRNLTATSIHI